MATTTFTVRMGLTGLTADALLNKGRFVVAEMTAAVAIYATPSPTLASVTTALDTLEAANGAVLNRGKSDFQARRVAYNAVKLLLQQLAGYVQQVAAGDENKILASGFEVRRRSGPIGDLNPPANLAGRITTLTGRVSLDWDRERGADTYKVFRSDTSDPFKWDLVAVTTRSRFNVDSLTPGTFYWFAVSAIGAAGESSKSDVLRAMAAA
ncbi:MAG: fibronectin type III domain-containing protein [Flavobacteriales bacterium]